MTCRIEPGCREPCLDRRFERGKLGVGGPEGLRRIEDHLPRSAAGEDPVEGIEILLGDGVKLVIVAAGAGGGEPEERLGIDIDLVLDHLHLVVEGIDRYEAELHHPQMRRADRRFIEPLGGVPTRIGEEVAGDLLAHELVVGEIVVERPDEVIAVAPRIGKLGVPLAAVRLAVADEIHPVAREALAEARGGEHSVDSGRVGCRRRIGGEGQHLLGAGREPGEDERQPPQEHRRGSDRGRLEAGCVESGGQKAIDRVVGPIGAACRRWIVAVKRLKTPPSATLGEIGRGCGRAGAGGLTRIRGAGRDPGAEGGERVVVEALAPLRHLETGQLVSQNGEESAVLWSTGNEDRPPCPTGAHSLAVVEDEPTFRRTITAVAFLAVLDEHRADPGFEEIKGVIGREPRRRDRAEHHRRPQARGQTALDGTTTPAR